MKGNVRKIAIFGATSAMARGAARRFASEKAEFVLVARSAEKLEAVKADLQAFGAARVESVLCDLSDVAAQAAALDAVWNALGEVDAVLVAYGSLPDQKACEADTALAMREFANNGSSAIALCNEIGKRLEAQGRGCLAVISSVAADRGRESNYLYGSAKAALATFVDGMAVRLSKKGIRVVDVKPGLVSSPMTAHLKQGPLFASSDKVGAGIAKAIADGKTEGTLYLPGIWALIMFVVRHVPYFVFKKTRF